VEFTLPQGEASSTKTATVTIKKEKRDSESYDSEDWDSFEPNKTYVITAAERAADKMKKQQPWEEEAKGFSLLQPINNL